MDALWTFVRKKEAHLTVAEKVLALYGEAWMWIAFAPAWRLVAALVVGTRDPAHANVLLERVQAVSGGSIPLSLPVAVVLDTCCQAARSRAVCQRTYMSASQARRTRAAGRPKVARPGMTAPRLCSRRLPRVTAVPAPVM